MRIVYVTACLPFGRGEAFIVDELNQLMLNHDVLVVPRSPGHPGPHGVKLIPYTMRENLISARVLITAVRVFATMPIRTLRSCSSLLQSHSPKIILRNLAVLPKALWLAQIASQWRADHIHCHWAGTTATMTLVASGISGIPWTLTAHRSDIVGNNLLREKVNSARVVRAISLDGKRMLLERGVEPSDKIYVLPMGVAIPERCCYEPTQAPVVLCPADLVEVKGHRYLFQAWRFLQDRGVRAELWLAGEGPCEPSLRRLAEDLTITSTVKFLGTVPHERLLDYYANNLVSAVALASVDLGNGLHEGIPVALVEAMSYGVPVVAAATGGIPELIHAGTGLLVPACDPAALADALQQILTHPEFAQNIGRNGLRHITQTRDVVSIVATLESFFCNSSKATPATSSTDAELRV